MFGKKRNQSPLSAPRGRTTKDQVISVIKSALDSQDFKYKFDEENNVFVTSFMGDDLPIGTLLNVRDEVLHFAFFLNLKASPENYKEVVWELNIINKNLMFGTFYLDPDDGMISFDYGFPYSEVNMSQGFFLAFTHALLDTVDENDGKLKRIAEKSMRSIDNLYV